MNKELPVTTVKGVVRKTLGGISKKFLENKGLVLTSGIIVCNTAALALIYKNSARIHEIIFQTKQLANSEDVKDKQAVYKSALIELAKLAGPALALELTSIICTIQLERKNMKNEAKIAELTAAATLLQNTISEYNVFKDEARKELGEEKYRELKDEVTKQQIIAQYPVAPAGVRVNPGERLCYFPYLDKWFSGTKAQINEVMDECNYVLERNQGGSGYESIRGNEVVLIEDICRKLKIDDNSLVSQRMGYESQRTTYINYSVGEGSINEDLYFVLNLYTDPYQV